MYSDAFCKVYNEFGWNYFPEIFGEQLLEWLEKNQLTVKTSLDLACGTGVLCEILHRHGVEVRGMDFSEGMIQIARERNPEIAYEVADMITYRPEQRFDLVTCTGDALNHIHNPEDVEQIFKNIYGYLEKGGHFIFDILKEEQDSQEEPVDLDFSEEIKAQFRILQDPEGMIHLKTAVFENGEFQFEEHIREVIYSPEAVCEMLERNGFQVLQCADHLLEQMGHQSTTWCIVARKC